VYIYIVSLQIYYHVLKKRKDYIPQRKMFGILQPLIN
jgi:hypothetical protein